MTRVRVISVADSIAEYYDGIAEADNLRAELDAAIASFMCNVGAVSDDEWFDTAVRDARRDAHRIHELMRLLGEV